MEDEAHSGARDFYAVRAPVTVQAPGRVEEDHQRLRAGASDIEHCLARSAAPEDNRLPVGPD
jgi:hypothetical protein